ncbi:hypothetical protein EPUS_08748 [Endocarpon pusillum Z07020]|uniref:Uncharacterized protein n=1 Tax=Endocarpon pusillum (strain Z07020 / HMAS-L-300199) TaxID=1263415 RepID=U1G5J6_ENDPU|nr:uncharacterized protein EPUS_08748 [Endocarpon pusillum Z07020]ERF72612.1 hypothetical protein EPUS_08748 [Endocarpon pusillum Z07020]
MVNDQTNRSRSKISEKSEEMDGTATPSTPTPQEQQQHRPGRLLRTPPPIRPYDPVTAIKEKWLAEPSAQAETDKEAPKSAYIQEEPRTYLTGPPARRRDQKRKAELIAAAAKAAVAKAAAEAKEEEEEEEEEEQEEDRDELTMKDFKFNIT